MHNRGKVVSVIRDVVYSSRNRSDNEKELYFDKNVFSLLEQKDIQGKEEWLYSTITKSLKNRFDSFPLYISRLVYIADNTNSNFGYYKVLCANGYGEIFSVVIDLQNAKEKNAQTFAEVKIKEPAPATDVTFFPKNLNPYSDECQGFFNLLNKEVEALERKKATQHEKFWEGSLTFDRPAPEMPSIITRTYNTTDYSLDEAVSLFPELSQVKDAVATTRQAAEALKGFIEHVQSRLNEAKLDERETEKIFKQSFGQLPSDLTIQLNSLKTELGLSEQVQEQKEEEAQNTSLLERIERDTKLTVINYKNAQAKLSNLKNAVAYAIYRAVHAYYVEEVQLETQGKPAERKKKIESFNKHFEMLGCIQIGHDGSLSDIGLVYQTLQNMTLTQIQDFVTRLLRNGESGKKEEGCDSSIFFNSRKLTKMISNINQAAKDVSHAIYGSYETQIGVTKEPLFVAVGKTFGLNTERYSIINPATFNWHPEVLEFEKEVNNQVAAISDHLFHNVTLSSDRPAESKKEEEKSKEESSESIDKETESKTKESKFKKIAEVRAGEYARLQSSVKEKSKLAQDAVVLANNLFDEKNGLVRVKFAKFSSFMSDYEPAKKMATRANHLSEILTKSKLEIENTYSQITKNIEAIKQFNESESDSTVMSNVDLKEIESQIVPEYKKFLKLYKTTLKHYDTILSLLSQLSIERDERKVQLEKMQKTLEALESNLQIMNSIVPNSLRHKFQTIENFLLHQVETISLINEKKYNKKIYIQKRIQAAYERLEREHLPPAMLVVDQNDLELSNLLLQYHAQKKEILLLEEKYKKAETGIDKVDEDVKKLEKTYDEIVSTVQQLHNAVARRKVFAEILERLKDFDPGVDIDSNPIHSANLQAISKVHQDLKNEFENGKITEVQLKSAQFHIEIFITTSTTLGNIYKEINSKHYNAELLQEIYQLQDVVELKLDTYQKELDAIKRFPDLVKFQGHLANVNKLLVDSERSGWREDVNKFRSHDNVLKKLEEKYDHHKRNIMELISLYLRCDMDIIQEQDVSIADLSNRLIREYEAAYAYEQEIIKRVGYHNGVMQLSRFVTTKVDPTLGEFEKLVSGLSRDNDLLNSIIFQYRANANQVERVVAAYRNPNPELISEKKLQRISQTTATVENLFQNAGAIFARIEESLASVAMHDGHFLEKFAVNNVLGDEGVNARYVVRLHARLSDLINDLDTKYFEFYKAYHDKSLEDWPKEGRHILDTSYRLKKLRHEIELSCGIDDLSDLRRRIIYTEKSIKFYHDKINSSATSKEDKKTYKMFLKSAKKELKNQLEIYANKKKEFYHKLTSKENPLAVPVEFYKNQVGSLIDVMTKLSSKMSVTNSKPKREGIETELWMGELENDFSQNLDQLVSPFAEKPPRRQAPLPPKPPVLVEDEYLQPILPGESKIPTSPVLARVKKFEKTKSDSAQAVFTDIMEIDFNEFEQIISEMDALTYENPVPKQFIEIDKILQADPVNQTYLSGAEMQKVDYKSFAQNVKQQVLYNNGSMTTTSLIQTYKNGEIGLITLLNLNNVINPPKSKDVITLGSLHNEIMNYEKHEGKGIFRRIFGDTQTIRDLKLLHNQLYQDKINELLLTKLSRTERKEMFNSKDSKQRYAEFVVKYLAEINSVEIPVQSFELIFRLRNERSSFTRKGSYQHRSLTLFKHGQDKPEVGKKTKELSHTEEVIDHLRGAIRKAV